MGGSALGYNSDLLPRVLFPELCGRQDAPLGRGVCMITGPLQWKGGGLLIIWGSLGPYKNRQRRIATMAETTDSDHRR